MSLMNKYDGESSQDSSLQSAILAVPMRGRVAASTRAAVIVRP